MPTLRLLLFVTFLKLAYGQKKCTFQQWDDQRISASTTFGDNLGRLATIQEAEDESQCAFHCNLHRYCNLAEFSRYGASSTSCRLFYYHFPPLYLYEIESPMRVAKPEFVGDKTSVLFNFADCLDESGESRFFDI